MLTLLRWLWISPHYIPTKCFFSTMVSGKIPNQIPELVQLKLWGLNTIPVFFLPIKIINGSFYLFFLSSSISVYLHKFSLYIRYLYHLSSYITYHFITIYREDIAYKVISSITISSIRSAYIVITILPISSYNHPIYPYLSQKPWQPQHHWAPLRHWSAALLLSRSGFKPRGWNMGKWGDTLW